MPPIGTILFGIALVIDGDTLSLDGERLRLQGIDAPEAGQQCLRDDGSYDCGLEAAGQLRLLLGNRRIICMVKAADETAALASCESGGQDIGGAMLEAGWAFAALKSARSYVALEQAARAARLGLWSGSAEAPWLWRQRTENR